MEKTPMCPQCGEDLEYDGFYYDECDGDKVYFSCSGYCDHCHSTYVWTESYVMDRISGMRKTGTLEVLDPEEIPF